MKYTAMSVEDLCNLTKDNYNKMFNKHLKEFYTSIMDECKKGLYEANLFPRDYREQCNEPLDVVDDVVDHIKTLFKGIKIKMMDDYHSIIGDGFHYEASWGPDVVTENRVTCAGCKSTTFTSNPEKTQCHYCSDTRYCSEKCMNEHWDAGHEKQCSGRQWISDVPVPEVPIPEVPVVPVPSPEIIADVTPSQESPLRFSQRLLEKASTL